MLKHKKWSYYEQAKRKFPFYIYEVLENNSIINLNMLILRDFDHLTKKMKNNLKYINFSLDKCPVDHYIYSVQ